MEVATTMIVLFVIVGVGYGLHKRGIMNKDFDRRLSNFVINVSNPCLILSSVMTDTMPDAGLILPLLGLSLLTYAFLIVAAWLLPRVMPIAWDDRGFYRFMLVFGNVGFIGFPVVASIFGHEAIFYASVLNIPNTLIVFTVGSAFITGKHDGFDYKILLQPSLIASYISVAICFLGYQMPEPITRIFTYLGNITIPSTLLIVGSSIAALPKRKMLGSRGTFSMALLRLLVLPICVLFLSRLLGFSDLITSINTLIIAMPVATFGTLFCIKYGRGEDLMAQGTFLTTALSVATIPIIALLI